MHTWWCEYDLVLEVHGQIRKFYHQSPPQLGKTMLDLYILIMWCTPLKWIWCGAGGARAVQKVLSPKSISTKQYLICITWYGCTYTTEVNLTWCWRCKGSSESSVTKVHLNQTRLYPDMWCTYTTEVNLTWCWKRKGSSESSITKIHLKQTRQYLICTLIMWCTPVKWI